MNKHIISLIVLLVCVGTATAQYPFESKKDEKLYLKLEELYEEGDYAGILKNEGLITVSFLNKKDTLTALMYGFLGESYMYWEGDYTTALDLYEKEYALRLELGQKGEDIRNLIFNLGYIQDELGYYAKTEDLYLELFQPRLFWTIMYLLKSIIRVLSWSNNSKKMWIKAASMMLCF
jgi:hypothetical protein